MEESERKVQNESPKRTKFYSISCLETFWLSLHSLSSEWHTENYDNSLQLTLSLFSNYAILHDHYILNQSELCGEISTLKTSLNSSLEKLLQKVLNQRHEKNTLFPGQGIILSIDSTSEERQQKYGCYCYLVGANKTGEPTDKDSCQYIISLVSDHEELLSLFRSDLDKYCLEIGQYLEMGVKISSVDISTTALSLLENWYANSITYLVRCIQALQDNIKVLIYSALLDNKLVTSGGTAELQSDIQRFYSTCSLSDILSQLKDSRNPGTDSETSSIDMLIDVDQSALETQGITTVSITADSVKLDASGCNKFCEEWANALQRQDCQDNPARLKQIIEAFKLKFIQTMNTLKRILREAENDYYALYRSYVFLRDSGNSEILLHYVTVEAASDVKDVLHVLQDFIKEKQT